MSEVTLREFVSGGLWSRVRATGICPIPSTVPHFDESIDRILRTDFGSRIVRTIYVEDGLDDVAKLLGLKFSDTWGDLFELSKTEFKLSGPEKVTVTSGTKERSNKSTAEEVNKTSAFDSDEMVGDTARENSNVEGGTDTNNSTTSSFEKNLKAATENLQYKFALNIINGVVSDIVSQITLKTY